MTQPLVPARDADAVARYLATLPILESERKPSLWLPDAENIVALLLRRGWTPPAGTRK